MHNPRYRSALQWWSALLAVFAVLLVPLPTAHKLAVLSQPPGSQVFLFVGLLTLFFSRSNFHHFKRAVVAFSATNGKPRSQLWHEYFCVRRSALLLALLPAMAALLGRMLGLDEVPQFLLCFASLLLLWLYRTPRQLHRVIEGTSE